MAIKNRSYGVCKFGLLQKEKFLNPSPMKYISRIVLYLFLSLFLAIPSILIIVVVVVVVVDVVIVIEWLSCY